ncbi:SH3 domain-containing protein [Terrisporobacter petrolearius]|uniref:SH3 domain-containing protein n=1 Tax=Terrisporobacter petrolearius TaxID=1460447 RepID=UPI003B00B59E
MKRNMKAKALLVAALLTIGGIVETTTIGDALSTKSSIATQAKSSKIKTGTITSKVNMRKGASTKYKVVTKLKKNAKVTVVKKMSNNWYQVKYSGKTGYVSGKYLKVTATNNNTTYSNQLGVTTNNVNMRSGTSTKYKVVAKLRKNADIDVLKKMSNGWYQVKCNRTTGYISGKYIKLTSKRGKSLEEFEKLLPSMGFEKKGDRYNYYENGSYCGGVLIHDPNGDYDEARFYFKNITPSYEKVLKKCFNLLLPSQGDKLLNMVKNKSIKQGFDGFKMDGRMIHTGNFNNVIDVSILEYYDKWHLE